MITLHKKKYFTIFLFFYEILDWEIFQAILGNLEEIRVQKTTARTLDRQLCFSQSF